MGKSKLSLFRNTVSFSNEKYLEYVEKKSANKNFIGLLKEKDRGEREKIWEANNELFDPDEISNPYFIGTGNPESEILIVGKELGFDNKKRTQFYNEVVQNPFDWEELLQRKNIVVKDYLNPKKPYNGHYLGLSGGHTWRKYNSIVSKITNETCDLDNSFFNYCFLTEFNTSPSKYSIGKHVLSDERKEFLQNNFFKSFKYIILTYRTYDKYNEGLTEILFDVVFVKRGEFEKMDKIRKQSFLHFTDKRNERNIVLTNQLSGSAGWSDDELQQLSNLLKQ